MFRAVDHVLHREQAARTEASREQERVRAEVARIETLRVEAERALSEQIRAIDARTFVFERAAKRRTVVCAALGFVAVVVGISVWTGARRREVP